MSKLTDEEIHRIYREVGGVNLASPAIQAEIRDEIGQRRLISQAIAVLHQRTHPTVLLTQLVAALAFLCDEHHVDREHVVRVFREAVQRHNLEMSPSSPSRDGG